jgi:hypothetical protein
MDLIFLSLQCHHLSNVKIIQPSTDHKLYLSKEDKLNSEFGEFIKDCCIFRWVDRSCPCQLFAHVIYAPCKLLSEDNTCIKMDGTDFEIISLINTSF